MQPYIGCAPRCHVQSALRVKSATFFPITENDAPCEQLEVLAAFQNTKHAITAFCLIIRWVNEGSSLCSTSL